MSEMKFLVASILCVFSSKQRLDEILSIFRDSLAKSLLKCR